MTNIVILGTGNLAWHLYKAFEAQPELAVVQVFGRNKTALRDFQENAPTTSDLNTLLPADIYILAVSDHAIGPLAKSLVLRDSLLVHTSGSTSMDALSPHSRIGVFYPLQTFSKAVDLDFTEVPLCIEVNNSEDQEFLTDIGKKISNSVHEVSSAQRMYLHLAAVFTNNFTNHLFHLGQNLCETQQLPYEILTPLIRQTVKKLEQVSAYDAQTGPARRGDVEVMKMQQKLLENQNYAEIYALLSKSIQKLYGIELQTDPG